MSQLTKAPAQKPPSAPSSFTPTRRALVQRKCACGGTPGVDGECEQCRRKRLSLQRKANDGSALASVPPLVHDVINSPGRPLDAGTRDLMQARFGHDFSQVRVHTDSAAEASARAVNARAYTVGQDIAFDRGQYQPSTPDGQHLLAHELAHTIQQRGLQKSARDARLDTRADSVYEREAESAADAVTAARSPIITALPRQPLVSRKLSSECYDAASRGLSNPEFRGVLEHVVIQQDYQRCINPNSFAEFRIPKSGPGGEAGFADIVDIPGYTIYEIKSGTPTNAASGVPEIRRYLAMAEKHCDPEVYWGIGKSYPAQHPIRRVIPMSTEQVVVAYQMVDQYPGVILYYTRKRQGETKSYFEHADKRGVQTNLIPPLACDGMPPTAEAPEKVTPEVPTQPYEIIVFGKTVTLQVPVGFGTKSKEQTVALQDNAANAAVTNVIPGLILKTLRHKGTSDTIDAELDTSNTKQMPIQIPAEEPERKIVLNINRKTRQLTLPKKGVRVPFQFKGLSTGRITKLDYSEEMGLSGEGKIKPTLRMLPELGIAFSRQDFRVTTELNKEKLKPPIPGAKLTRADIALILAPEFRPSGTVALEYAKGDKKLLDAAMELGLDAQGLMAKGKVNAYLPGVDKAEGNVLYSGGVWSGGVVIESTQIKLPYIKGGKVTVAFSEKTGIDAGGKVNLELPGGNTAEVGLEYTKSRWVFIGRGEFNLPRLDPVRVHVFYDGESLIANGKTGFKLYGLKGRVDVTYTAKSGESGKVTGKGELEIAKGKAKGTATIILHPSGKFSGEGSITYQISENLIATAGIVIDEKEKVTLKGALEFPKPIKLFEGIKGDKVIFKTGITIPIPGASIGPVGLVVKIDGSLGARYGIGPGEIRGVKIEAAFNPLENRPDPVLDMAGTLYIPAYAGIYGSIRGALAISIAVASVSGGLTVTASADLDGKVQASIKLHYEKSRFALDALAEIDAGLVLGLKLDADVKAEAGIGPFSVETKKVWNLANYRYDTGLKFGMKAPLHYATDEPFHAPSLDQIQWVTPQIDPQQMLKKLMA